MEKKKLRNAVWVSYWGVPVLVTVFVVTYWIIGLKNYHNKGEVAQEEKEEEEEIMLSDAAAHTLTKTHMSSKTH